MYEFDFNGRTQVIFGSGSFERVGELALGRHFRRVFLVADRGMVSCGYVAEASRQLARAGIKVFTFHDFGENPDTEMVEAGRRLAEGLSIDSIIALGGGSTLDCAKGINFVLTGGGAMRDYWGYGKLSEKTDRDMLPMFGIPTTAGTGSDAQSYALISDARTHIKMACGDRQAAFRLVLLDPRLTVTMPASLTAITGYDAISHAVESYVTTKRNPLSETFSREAWRLLEANYERVLTDPANIRARGAMLLGSYYAGLAIENSMLGAAHACANPLTSNHGTTHGVAVALVLPHVVRWNDEAAGERYRDLAMIAGLSCDGKNAGDALASRLEQLRRAGGLPENLTSVGVSKSDLENLSEEAARQWTGGFNPRQWSAAGAMEVYSSAL